MVCLLRKPWIKMLGLACITVKTGYDCHLAPNVPTRPPQPWSTKRIKEQGADARNSVYHDEIVQKNSNQENSLYRTVLNRM